MADYQLITRNLQEIIGDDKLRQIVSERPLKLYWGTSPTGKPHIGYLVPLIKLADFIQAQAEVTILIADLHAYLDSMKLSPTWNLVNARSEYYVKILTAVLKSLQVDLMKIKFVKGSSFQLQPDYNMDMYNFMAQLSVRDATKAGSEVVKQTMAEAKTQGIQATVAKQSQKGKQEAQKGKQEEKQGQAQKGKQEAKQAQKRKQEEKQGQEPTFVNCKMSCLMYPALQALDEEYLKVDAQFGGVDQRKIFALAHDFLPKLGYSARIHLMNPLVPSFTASGKMSSSEVNSKIDFLDSVEEVQSKIKKAFCVDGDIQNCPLLSLAKYVIFPICELCSTNFVINRPEKYGGKLEFSTYDELENAFATKQLFSVDLKLGVADFLNEFLSQVRNNLGDVSDLIKLAYP